ncbi:NADPH-dependent diflavin oxidoreductase 1-like [Hyalella azteca]|uniref:NADPH-dependent diflavin oxidoreductase 1 n=1 Tax=Hyalella azteca TaxID=294128 RepID=A0A8B7PB33_HYAAZ|nr:NADPH-dependent diflavin oxidoreductase 1-like [Hyalella azteca]
MVPSASNKPSLSRLEVNFLRVFRETQQMASGAKPRSWSFEKLLRCRRLVVLYGSETGTAQQVAERVVREAHRRRFTSVVLEMNSADVDLLRGAFPDLQAGLLPPACLSDASKQRLNEIVLSAVKDKSLIQKVSPAFDGASAAQTDSRIMSSVEHLNLVSSDDNSAMVPTTTARILPVLTCNALEPTENSQGSGFDEFNDVFENNSVMDALYSVLPPLCVVCVAATTGQGDDPENMKKFFENLWNLRSDRQLLRGVNFGVLALGDSSYQKFNYSGKRMNNLLRLLGAQPVLPIGLADDQHDLGPDFVVDSWLAQLWQKLEELYPLPEDVAPMASHELPPPRFKVEFLDEFDSETSAVDEPVGYVQGNFTSCSLTKIERVSAPGHFQNVQLVEFDVSHMEYKHKPGDVLMIKPENLSSHVQEFLDVIGLDRSRKFRVRPSEPNTNVSDVPPWLLSGCTIKKCVTKYLDIMSVPKRYFFELLSFFTTDEMEKEKFLEFASSVGQQELYDYCNRPKRSIVEVLADFPHVNKNIPFEYLFDVIPSLKPRAYSIASSSALIPGKAQILMAVVNYRTNLRRPRLGVCSNWLAALRPQDTVLLSIKKGSLRFTLPSENVTPVPQNHQTYEQVTAPQTCSPRDGVQALEGAHEEENFTTSSSLPPVIMIAPGTGVAPFRSYIQERIALGLTSAPMILFFGCRGKNTDFFFEEEWRRYHPSLELYTAFSRDQEDKIYVQHRIREQAQRLWPLIHQADAQVFLAGNAKRIPIDVHEALTDVCKFGLCDDKLADVYMKNSLGKRYQTETWA